MSLPTTNIGAAAAVLKHGNAAIYPTETVYGLGVSVRDAESPAVLFDIKQRSKAKPIAWLVGGVDDLTRYGKHVPKFACAIARTFWPGPLTLIVKAGDAVPERFRSAEGTIGLRMPNNDTALALISEVGCPLATTSANFSGYKPPRRSTAIDPDLAARVEAVLVDEDDSEKSGVASTILDCTGDHPVMVREGAISIADIKAQS